MTALQAEIEKARRSEDLIAEAERILEVWLELHGWTWLDDEQVWAHPNLGECSDLWIAVALQRDA